MRVATWNLEHFWPQAEAPLLIRKNGQATRVRDQRLLDRTRQAVQRLGADIFCFQEISGPSSVNFLSPETQNFTESRLDEAAAPTARYHGLGLAVRQGVSVRVEPPIPLSQAEGCDHYARDALVLRYQDRFRIVGLHLKSGCRDKLRLDKRAACRVLQAQVTMLCDWLADQDMPLLLLGDFNRVLGQPRDPVLARLQAAAPLALAPLTFRQIDHVLAPPNWDLKAVGSGGMQGFSDHRPVAYDVQLPSG